MNFKRYILFLFLAAAVLTGAFARAEETPFQVDDFLRAAKKEGAAAVVGVVDSVQPGQNRFGLIDAKKFGCCDSPINCAKGVLPVLWKGELPKPKATVRARGKVEEMGGKLIFVADSVKVLETPK